MEIQSLLIHLTLMFLPMLSQSPGIVLLSNSTDQQSLLAFKSHNTYDPSSVLDTWNSSTPFCTWVGVTCNVTKQRVTGLNLASFSLGGIIAPHITNLSFLSALNLQNNRFSGKIPKEIGLLFRVRTLNFSSNSLEGNIPASLGLCSKLVLLDLSSNRLEGKIPYELGMLNELDAILLTNNFLSGPIPTSFGNLSSLTNLILSRNSLGGSLPESLGHLPRLVNIEVSLNFIEGEIPRSVFNSSSLIQLAVAGNRLSGVLPSDMFVTLTSLAILYSGGNQFYWPLPISLGNASSLVRADLSRNNFTGHIPLLWNLPNIQVLSFDTNQLISDGKNGWDFLTSLSNCTQLQVFSLASNLLTGKLRRSVGNLSRQLSLLAIGGNQIEGDLPVEIGNLVGLTMLSIEHNTFSGNIPSSIGNLSILQNLYLHENNFSGIIPESLGSLAALSEMSLLRNALIGSIPSSLGNLQHLQILDFSSNILNGSIPAEIFSIPSFGRLLNLSYNLLSGCIPDEIGNLNMIQAIDISHNHLTREIPSTVGGCVSLEYLDVSRNLLEGPIQSSLSNMKGIEYINLSSNNPTGDLPNSLESLKYLQFLDISMNDLQGKVPMKGVFAHITAVSLAGNPKLCGGLPGFKLANCTVPETKKHSSRPKVKLITGISAGFIAILPLLGGSILCQNKPKTNDPAPLHDEGKYKIFSYYNIKSATRDFSPENLIGSGSFGSVYKGVFSDGSVLAIKVFNMDRNEAAKSFVAECEALRNIRHHNHLKMISVCSTSNFKALVFPYMRNGSLEQWLQRRTGMMHVGDDDHDDDGDGVLLDVWHRLEIARDVAHDMQYMHHDCEPSIVHCDLKPSNVLLDENMCAHVADFGIARILDDLDTRSNNSTTLGLKGSIGDIAPEYGVGGRVTT